MASCFCSGACKNGGGCSVNNEKLTVGSINFGPEVTGTAVIPPPTANVYDTTNPLIGPWWNNPSPMIPGSIFNKPLQIVEEDDEATPGFKPIKKWKNIIPCTDPGHAFPSHLHVPPGMKYVHICSTCKQKTVVHAPSFTL